MINIHTLGLVLQFDTETKENTNTCFLTVDDRWEINRTRSLMIGQITFDAHIIPVAEIYQSATIYCSPNLYTKIQKIVTRINHQRWKPLQIIEYKF